MASSCSQLELILCELQSYVKRKLNESKWDHVYLRHLSTDIGILSGWYGDWHSADMSAETQSSVVRHVVWVNLLVNTRSTGRPICSDRQLLVYWSTVGDVLVDGHWYRSIVNHCFAEITAVSVPTGDAKESIAYARVLTEWGCSSNCRHFE